MGARSKFRIATVIAFFVVASSSTPALAERAAGELQTLYTLPHLPGQILVKRTPGTPVAVIEQLLSSLGGEVLDFSSAAQIDVIGIDDDAELENAITILRANIGIEFAEPNFTSGLWGPPNDINFPQQWSKDNNGLNAPSGLGHPGADLNMVAAWDKQATATGVLIAVIDDSLDTTHADLVENVVTTGRCFDSPNSSRPCANGPNDPNPVDSGDFHGTLVAGSVAARGNNTIGVAGVVWETNLLPLKVDLSYYAIVNAIDEAIAQGADIINMSFGGPAKSQSLSEAIERAELAGILILASAGNADASNDTAAHYPSDEPQANVLSVAATDSRDRIANFSQWGASSVHIAAPGERILTTANGDAYASVSGTSFSAPHAAGVAALIQAKTGASDYEQIKAHLLHGTVDGRDQLGPVVPGQDKEAIPGRTATGRLDADMALTGPTGGVVVVSRVEIDDAATGNGNRRLDPGETAQLNVTLTNVWSDIAVSGTLSSPDSGSIVVNDLAPVAFGTISRNEQATASFSVTLSSALVGNQQLFMKLDLSSANGDSLPARYFYVEVGALENGVDVRQSIQRYDWDEFQAFHVDVPAGASNLEITTTGSGDVDLIVRYGQSPEYLITLNAAAGEGFYYVDSESIVRAGSDANESVSIENPLPGTYHVVVVNFDQQAKAYDISANYNLPSVGEIAFTEATYRASENAGTATITVTRSGGVGGASVNYSTADETAKAGEDYEETSGTLVWGLGENGDKTFAVPILEDETDETTETLRLSLSGVEGAGLGGQSVATLEISENASASGVLAFAGESYSVAEGATTLTVSVSRTGSSAGAATVEFATQDGQALAGSDFSEATGVLTWASGDSADKTIDIGILDDTRVEGRESFSIELSNAQGASMGNPMTATVLINDDDIASAGSGGGGGGRIDLLTLLALLLFCRSTYVRRSRVG